MTEVIKNILEFEIKVGNRRNVAFREYFKWLVQTVGRKEGRRLKTTWMVRQQPEFIYRETAEHLIMRPFRWFHYPRALSFHKDINSRSWLAWVKLYENPRGVLLKSAGVENFKERSCTLLQDQQLQIKRRHRDI